MDKYLKQQILETLRTWYIAVWAIIAPAAVALLVLPTDQFIAALKSPVTYIALVQLALLGLIKGKDRARHEMGSDLDIDAMKKGLTGF